MAKVKKGGKTPLMAKREEAILSHLRSHYEEYGYPPSYRELAAAIKKAGLGEPSLSVIKYMLADLAKDGKIRFTPKVARSIRILV